jgi:hypothetical protein
MRVYGNSCGTVTFARDTVGWLTQQPRRVA